MAPKRQAALAAAEEDASSSDGDTPPSAAPLDCRANVAARYVLCGLPDYCDACDYNLWFDVLCGLPA